VTGDISADVFLSKTNWSDVRHVRASSFLTLRSLEETWTRGAVVWWVVFIQLSPFTSKITRTLQHDSRFAWS
jgi:hypothetical protein